MVSNYWKSWDSTNGVSTTFCSTSWDMCQKVIVVGSNDLQSLYVANNVCSAVDYFRRLGGNVGVAGLVINKDDGTGEAQAFADAVGIPVFSAIPAAADLPP